MVASYGWWWDTVRTTHTVTDGINGCVCTDGSMLDKDLDDIQLSVI